MLTIMRKITLQHKYNYNCNYEICCHKLFFSLNFLQFLFLVRKIIWGLFYFLEANIRKLWFINKQLWHIYDFPIDFIFESTLVRAEEEIPMKRYNYLNLSHVGIIAQASAVRYCKLNRERKLLDYSIYHRSTAF